MPACRKVKIREGPKRGFLFFRVVFFCRLRYNKLVGECFVDGV